MTRDAKVRLCAGLAHEANREYCITIGDYTQPTWATAPDWQVTSAVKGVEGVLAGNTPEQSHEDWLAEKERTGWKYGPVKDPDNREHPCFVPYGQLSPEQRMKDELYVSVVRAMAKALGLLP